MPSPRSGITPSVRWKVFARDGFRCRYCGVNGGDAVLVVDHVHPVARGGRDHLDNLITACETCNQGKGATMTHPLPVLEIRLNAVDQIIMWLEGLWMREANEGWVPDDDTLLWLVIEADSWADVETVIVQVARRYRRHELIDGITPGQVCDLLYRFGNYLSVSRGFSEAHQLTFDLGDTLESFWRKPFDGADFLQPDK